MVVGTAAGNRPGKAEVGANGLGSCPVFCVLHALKG